MNPEDQWNAVENRRHAGSRGRCANSTRLLSSNRSTCQLVVSTLWHIVTSMSMVRSTAAAARLLLLPTSCCCRPPAAGDLLLLATSCCCWRRTAAGDLPLPTRLCCCCRPLEPPPRSRLVGFTHRYGLPTCAEKTAPDLCPVLALRFYRAYLLHCSVKGSHG
jgi:hypothetical protein